MKAEAEKNYQNIVREAGERLVSGSDDFTLFLWHPEKEKKPIGVYVGIEYSTLTFGLDDFNFHSIC